MTSPPWFRGIVFALNTSLRQLKILDLSWDSVDLACRAIYVGKQKKKGRDTLPLNAAATAVLGRRASVCGNHSGFVFSRGNGTPKLDRNLMKAYRRAMKSAGIEGLWFHDLRRTFATSLVRGGVDQYVVQRLMRHRGASMMQRYAHHNVESLRGGVESLEAKIYDSFMTAGE